jgi:single-strand DNA-binding protein
MHIPESSAAPSRHDLSTNVVVLLGTVTSDLTRRTLAAGTVVVSFDLATTVPDGRAGSRVSVPLVWHDPTDHALASINRDERIAVLGTIRRRFFRAGGHTQSRTEVVVDRLVLARRTKSVRSLFAAAANDLSGAGG